MMSFHNALDTARRIHQARAIFEMNVMGIVSACEAIPGASGDEVIGLIRKHHEELCSELEKIEDSQIPAAPEEAE